MWYVIHRDELYHHGIKGQRWGVRRFQNPDGSVTPAGADRYYVGDDKGTHNSKDNSKPKKKLSKGAKIAIGVAAVTAATTVAVLATRKYNSEKKILDQVLSKHGASIINSSQKLSNRLSELEYSEKYKNSSYKELSRKAQQAVKSNDQRIAKSRQAAKNTSNIARYLTDSKVDSLAAKSQHGNVGGGDVLKAVASSTVDRGKDAVKKLLNAA